MYVCRGAVDARRGVPWNGVCYVTAQMAQRVGVPVTVVCGPNEAELKFGAAVHHRGLRRAHDATS